jgi:Rps23 Pro-64 3,4-dihydroxylase Tpa1-like proline 4-hydroxylase
MAIGRLDRDALRKQFRTAQPFPFVVIDGFLEPEFALEVANAYPSYGQAERLGHTFKAVNEYRKVQITDYDRFPPAVRKLADAMKAPEFLATLSDITGIPDLLWDDTFAGGGMHQTGSHGLLDVHVDFNQLSHNGTYRRLNLLLYLNTEWREEWGGKLELWDRDVKVCHHSVTPALNRCVIFETSDHSFHGVTAVTCPPTASRNSFAIYCYTREAPAGWAGRSHSTIFKARPDEVLKKHVLMPVEQLEQRIGRGVRSAKKLVKKLIGRN